jgi:hypothetical protein
MVLPFVMGLSYDVQSSAAAPAGHGDHMVAASQSALVAGVTPAETVALLLGVHTMAYLLVMTLIAWVVYSRLGLALLRTAWFNLDWFWAAALVLTGAVVLLS